MPWCCKDCMKAVPLRAYYSEQQSHSVLMGYAPDDEYMDDGNYLDDEFMETYDSELVETCCSHCGSNSVEFLTETESDEHKEDLCANCGGRRVVITSDYGNYFPTNERYFYCVGCQKLTEVNSKEEVNNGVKEVKNTYKVKPRIIVK